MEQLSESQINEIRERIEETVQYGDTELNLSNLGLRVLPEEIVEELIERELDITIINLDNNLLTTLPENLSEIDLESIFLNDNDFEDVPYVIYSIRTLTFLEIKNNYITAVDEQIANLENLEILNLSNNSLTSLPASLIRLEQLLQLHIYGNPELTDIPPLPENTRLFTADDLEEGGTPETLSAEAPDDQEETPETLSAEAPDDQEETPETLSAEAPDEQEETPQEGVAFEVHNVFDKEFKKMTKNTDFMIKYVKDSGHSINYIPIYERYSGKEQINTLYGILKYIISIGYTGDQDKDKLLEAINNIFDKIYYQEIRSDIYDLIWLSLMFILTLNNETIYNEYIERFVDECVNAYPYDPARPDADRMSCPDGIRERFLLVFASVFNFVCCEENKCGTDVKGMCPDKTTIILETIDNNEIFNRYIGNWSYSDEEIPVRERKSNLIEFLLGKYTEGEKDEGLKEAVREKLRDKIEKMEIQQKANFKCVDKDDIFLDPEDCAESKTEQEGKEEIEQAEEKTGGSRVKTHKTKKSSRKRTNRRKTRKIKGRR
jgi:hypothetical protein